MDLTDPTPLIRTLLTNEHLESIKNVCLCISFVIKEVVKMALTDKQEKYIQELIKGKSQRQAYLAAYPKSKKWKDTSVDVEAAKLFARPNVLQRHNELKERCSNKAVITRQELIEGLKKAYFMALGVEYTPDGFATFNQGELKVNEFEIKKADLRAAAAIGGQIAKLEGWEIEKREPVQPIEINITAFETPNPEKDEDEYTDK